MLCLLHHIPTEETIRYALGCAVPKPVDPQWLSKAQTAQQPVLQSSQPRVCWRVFPSAPLLEQLLTGQDIRSHLSGCTDCILLAATLGAQVDTLIRRAQVNDMEQALWLDAAASAAIEEVCDTAQRQIAEQLGQSLTHRFSCGYGDLPLSIQPQLCTLLDSAKSIGLSVSHSSMLTPVKSVTAILGILPAGTVASAPKPCTICHLKENCVLRRKGVFCGKSTD